MNIWKSKESMLLIFSSGITFIGNGMHFIAVSWLIYQYTGNPMSVALLVILTTLPTLLTFPFTGVIADRFDRKKIVISMDVLRCVFVLIIPLMYLLNEMNIYVIYLLTILISISNNFFYPAFSGVVKSVVQERLFLKVISANSSMLQLGTIVGAGVAGLLIANYSIMIVFLIDGATFLVSALILLNVKYIHNKPESIKGSKLVIDYFLKDFLSGLKYIFNKKVLVYLFLIGILPAAIIQIINSLLSVYTNQSLGLGVDAYGMLDAIFAIGALFIGVLMTFVNNVNPQKLITFSFFIMGIGFLIISIAGSFFIAAIGLFLLGVSILMESACRKSLIMQLVDENYIGRVESFNWAIYSVIAPLCTIAATLFNGQIGTTSLFFYISVILIAISIFSVPFFNKNDLQINSETAMDIE
ncbi:MULTISPECIES: MFS transporter [Bacillus]|uniref:MFS transporter n=1 Tax=Bacillus TaxID=1386 RepID=UPI00028E0A13|nr:MULTISPECIES: MFS transporter [Bacillus]EKF36474.1 putative membrane transporter protein [Bacillus xiamenensis]MBD3861246.1 MFS transporter [Bacillus sp. 28A-2]MCW1837946.1 MFS transporter [Bacillus xiamenensis]